MQWLIQTIFLNLSCKIWQVYLSATLEIYITNTWNLNMISFWQISSIFANFALSWKSAFCQMLNAENYTGVEWQGLHQFQKQRERKMLLWNLDLHHWSFSAVCPLKEVLGNLGVANAESLGVEWQFVICHWQSLHQWGFLFPKCSQILFFQTMSLIRSFCIFGSDCMHFFSFASGS